MSINQKRKYLEKRGWITFRSPSYWVNAEIMDDMLDSGGVSLSQAYELQMKTK